MDMPGPADEPIDRVWRYVVAEDGSFRRTSFAEGLYAVFGIEDRDGAVYVMNMPHPERFVEELKGPEMTQRFSEKFGIDLTGLEILATAREYCQESDGAIHTDSKAKVVTTLFYFNKEWPHEGGRLRLLRSADDLENYEAEVSPEGGAMLAFRRSECSYHGHKPFCGHRRILQMHWVDPKLVAKKERKRRSLWWKTRKALGFG